MRAILTVAVVASGGFLAASTLAGCDGGPGDGPLTCEVEDDCAALGAGHMCMGGGCMVMETAAPAVVVPAATAADLELEPLVDQNPDPTIFEADLVAAIDNVELVPGAVTEAWVYKPTADAPASVPGPLIDVEEGTRVIIHFTNLLDEPTTIHWHGLVLPAVMDGAPDDGPEDGPGAGIAPGASFDFDFVAGDAALYWFHPHLRGDVQVERGLYGAFRVREREPITVDRERIFVLDDVVLDAEGAIAPPAEGPAMSADGTRMTFEGMMGRQGNRLLVNGASNPIVDVVAGSVERWRIVNVANSRFFRLVLPGHTFVVIGTDGGLVPVPRTVDELLLSPGERVDVLVQMAGAPGARTALLTRHHVRGHDMDDPGDLTLATVVVGDATALATPMPATSRDIPRLVAGATTQTVKMGEEVLRGARVGFSLNGEMWPNVTPLAARLGDEETWSIVNETDMDHPFHLHGFPFQVVDRRPLDGGVTEAESFLAWKDTVIVGPRQALRFVVRYDGFPGAWMFHCHILEHAERGMMSMVMVEE